MGLWARQEKYFPLSSTVGVNLNMLIVASGVCELTTPDFSSLLPFHHVIFAAGREPVVVHLTSVSLSADRGRL